MYFVFNNNCNWTNEHPLRATPKNNSLNKIGPHYGTQLFLNSSFPKLIFNLQFLNKLKET